MLRSNLKSTIGAEYSVKLTEYAQAHNKNVKLFNGLSDNVSKIIWQEAVNSPKQLIMLVEYQKTQHQMCGQSRERYVKTYVVPYRLIRRHKR